MAVGIELTQTLINEKAGDVARRLNVAFEQVEQIQFYLTGTQDADLEALGFTAGEVATLKSAYAHLDHLRKVYQGSELVEDLEDFRAFPRRLFGLGF